MSPQAANAPATANSGNGSDNPHAALLKRIGETDPEKRTSTQKQIARAVSLENQRGELMKKIAANREYLRLMEENEELGEAETAFLDDWYPLREKGSARSEDEIERTRKIKDSVRKAKL